jgi:hypothetical protein
VQGVLEQFNGGQFYYGNDFMKSLLYIACSDRSKLRPICLYFTEFTGGVHKGYLGKVTKISCHIHVIQDGFHLQCWIVSITVIGILFDIALSLTATIDTPNAINYVLLSIYHSQDRLAFGLNSALSGASNKAVEHITQINLTRESLHVLINDSFLRHDRPNRFWTSRLSL